MTGRKGIKIIKSCKACEKEFIVNPSNYNQKFCSKECYFKNYHPMLGKHFSKEHKHNLGLSHKGILNSSKRDEVRLKISESVKKLWQDPIYREKNIKATLKGLMKRPTSYEKKISSLCFKYNLPFLYKGNGSFLINSKNPDFVNEKDKIVIEVYYSYYKIRDYGSIENYEQFCKDKYESSGWKVIFINEIDLELNNWEEICLNKITGVIRCGYSN